MTDEELKNWDNADAHVCDDLWEHFAKQGGRTCGQTSTEALRVFNVMFNSNLDPFSNLSDLFKATANHANNLAHERIGAALGIDGDALAWALSPWTGDQYPLPGPVTFDRLLELVEEAKVRIANNKIAWENRPIKW